MGRWRHAQMSRITLFPLALRAPLPTRSQRNCCHAGTMIKVENCAYQGIALSPPIRPPVVHQPPRGPSMRIAQLSTLTEAVPRKLYGGTERVISWLTEELVAMGHDVTLFASGDSTTSAKLEAMWPKALRLDGSVRDPNALHMAMIEQV